MNKYKALKEKHQKQYNDFYGIFFAFSNERFNEGLKKFNVTAEDVTAIGAGGYILVSKVKDYKNMLDSFRKEDNESRKELDFCVDMFKYEMANHEYGWTRDLTDTLDSLGLKFEEIKNDSILDKALSIALDNYI